MEYEMKQQNATNALPSITITLTRDDLARLVSENCLRSHRFWLLPKESIPKKRVVPEEIYQEIEIKVET